MNRRQLLLGSAVTLLAAGVGAADKPAAGEVRAGGEGSVADVVGDCLAKGEVCLSHCLTLLGSGDTSLAQCGRAVADMLAVNGALMRLAAGHSQHLPGMAALAVAVSKTCEAECRKHADKHPPCKACGEACARTATAAGALAS